MREPTLIDLDPAHRTDGAIQGASFGKGEFDANRLQALRTDRHDILLLRSSRLSVACRLSRCLSAGCFMASVRLYAWGKWR
jgi:hypothetical protein